MRRANPGMGKSEVSMTKKTSDEEQVEEIARVAVRVIETRGETVLVEYRDALGLRRTLVPVQAVEGGKASEEELAYGVPYGLPWEDLIEMRASAAQLAANLRAAGIWTREDLERSPAAAFGALQATYGIDLAAIITAAKQAREV